ncbi:MAG: cell division FtsK/SpoIIIE [uncultured bacterium (gcode 4)]|uniref:Cell division FtsK/SpoIIIE n=1 Tax=uncultured bacterium (gcode 4) TaxID=1234023 RepID=K2H2V9_9BACT|nr:MAG: cell division FtsK/SpoIIIE [uncultured bacterium (gcode 4)]
MAKNKKAAPRPFMTQKLQNIIAWLFLCALWVITIFWKDSIFWAFFWDILLAFFWDYFTYLISPVFLILWVLISIWKIQWNYARILWILLYCLSADSLVWFYSPQSTWFFDFSTTLRQYLGWVPTFVFLMLILWVSIYLLFKISYIEVLKKVWWWLNSIKDNVKELKSDIAKDYKEKDKEKDRKKAKWEYKDEIELLNEKIKELSWKQKPSPIKVERKELLEIKKVQVEKKSVLDFFSKKEEPKKPAQTKLQFASWDFPSSELLQKNLKKYEVDEKFVEKQSLEIQKTLLEFNIKVSMDKYTVGPTVIQYRLKPSEWVKLNKIENLKKDLTLALKAKSIRIQAPIPGMWLVWVEVPNEKREVVAIRDLIESKEFINHKSNLALVVWKNINWSSIIADLAKMPHLLIAGQTWSGKSVAMNWFIVSLLYKNSPDMLRLIMIDPKRVELSIYNWIPHLLAPIISDHEKALNSLKWCVAEMMRRYDIMTHQRARNLEEYNAKVVKKEKMPNIVIVIDELAELMWRNNKKDVENAITRMAQLWRASWMHLLVATQRPSVDVITGLIKANIPSRIALTVASQVDSRTILDQIWAEDLVWYWDMLYSPIWSEPERIQWVLVETDEVESVINHIKRTIDPRMLEDLYNEEITAGESSGASIPWIEWEYDEDPKVLEDAIKVVREAWKASTSLLQRRLKLWYARAARVIDILEEMWVVWPWDGSKPREVF